MSVTKKIRALTPPDIQAMKDDTPIACLTAYTTPVAQMIDEHIDLVLVGDSVGMVMHGMPNTLGVTMDMMVMHGRAVRRDPVAVHTGWRRCQNAGSAPNGHRMGCACKPRDPPPNIGPGPLPATIWPTPGPEPGLHR